MAAKSGAALEARMREGLALHQQGKLAQAEAAYRDVLARAPTHAQALGLLGLIEAAKRHVDPAIDLLRRSLAINPDNAANQFNLGLLLQEKREFAQALDCFSHAVRLRPDAAQAHNGRGMVQKELGRYDDALASYAQALRLAPEYFEAWNNQGVVLRHLDRAEQAVASFERAIALRPAVAEVHNNLGLALHALGNDEKALEAFGVSLRLDPGSSHAAMNMGVSLYELRRYEEAHTSLMRALEIDPSNLDVHVNLGNVLLELHRHDEALASYGKVADARPGDQDVLMNMGNALREMHRYAKALPYYQAAIELDPSCVEVQWNHALCLLAMGDFERGWEGFEWRRRSAAISDTQRRFEGLQWTGAQPLAGKTILLHAEQGLGDTIQFCRYAMPLAALGAKVLLEVQRPLVRVLQGLQGVSRFLVRGEAPPPYDYHCPLMSLPRAFGTRLETIPAPEGYLAAEPALVERWRPEIERRRGFNVGLAWAGNPAYKNNHRRLVGLERLLGALPAEINLWSLQKDIDPADREVMEQTGRVLTLEHNDFEHTAAQISLMDAVVSVDTSVPHLAAALGKPTWLLLSYSADWRWLSDRGDSPWYTHMKLFRQPSPGDWDPALRALTAHVTSAASARG
jgi:tetratricopeptide (TPR) repeat protein